MDIDDSSELGGPVSPFGVAFPLPYRVLSLVGVGVACWATNLHLLDILSVDTAHVLQIRNDKLPAPFHGRASSQSSSYNLTVFAHPSTLYPPIYKLLAVYFAWIVLGWLAFTFFINGDINALDAYKIIPIVSYLGIIGAAVVPFTNVLQTQRTLLYQ